LQKKNILDDISEIVKIDKSSMLSFCVDTAKHYEEAAKIAKNFSIGYPKPQKIIVAGMGGSAIGGELLKDLARDKVPIPIEVEREYSLPAYANKNTLVFVVSYSGETEETLSVFLKAIKRNCMIVCISSGGKLLEIAEKLNLPHIRIPSGIPPRAALPYLFIPLPIILEKIGLISNVNTEVSEAVKTLKKVCDENSPEKSLKVNFSKRLALNINETIPVVYGFGFYRAVAQRFKQQFNENSKVPSKWEFLPELDHNEIVGWEKAQKIAKNFSAIFIRDREEQNEIRQRIEVTKELMTKENVKVFEVWSVGKSKLAKMLSTITIGDFTSVYLAVLRKVDPTPVKTITMLKEKMKESGVKEKILCELQKLWKNSFG
jgi:glucose/mannose-6-phosphate isomerase